MPYKTIQDAKDGGFIITIDDVALTVEQINYIAKIYDAVKQKGEAENPMAVAIAQFKEAYEISGDKWVRKEQGDLSAILDAVVFEFEQAKTELVYTSNWKTQSVIFEREKFTLEAATKWAKSHDYQTDIDIEGIDRIESQWRFRQFDPDLCSEQGGIKEITDGVSLFICKLKEPEKTEEKKMSKYKPDYFSLSSVTNLAASQGGVIKNQIILHTGEWRGGDVTVTRESIDAMVKNWKVLSDKSTAPYLEPYVKSDHSWSVADIIGHWENLRGEEKELPTTGGKTLKVYALVGDEVITNPEAYEKIKRGEWTRRSAEFVEKFKDEGTGEKFQHVLFGSAYVDIPEITSIPPVMFSVAASTLSAAVIELRKMTRTENIKKKKEGGALTMDYEAIKAAMEKMIGEMQEMVGKMAEGEEKEEMKAELEAKKAELAAMKPPETPNIEDAVKAALEKKEAEIVEMRKKLEGGKGDLEELQGLKSELKTLRLERDLSELGKVDEQGKMLPPAFVEFVKEIASSEGSDAAITLRSGSTTEKVRAYDLVFRMARKVKELGLGIQMGEAKEIESKMKSEEDEIQKLSQNLGYEKSTEKK